MKMDIDWKKHWGVIPIAVFLLVKVMVVMIDEITNSVLRSIPQMVLSIFGVISVFILIFWGGWFCLWRNRKHSFKGIQVVRILAGLVYCVMVLGTFVMGMFVGAFTYTPEHVVEKYGIKMVASVDSFLQERVYYYEYKNALFRGREQIGWEDYGNGGADPIEEGQEPIRWNSDSVFKR